MAMDTTRAAGASGLIRLYGPGAFGLLAGLTVTLPLFGRILFLPGRVWALAAFGTALLLGLLLEKDRPALQPILFLAAMAAFFAVALSAASPQQFAFFLDPSGWLRVESQYLAAKLMMLTLSFWPCAILAVAFCCLSSKTDMLRGMFVAFLALAILAITRALIDSIDLVRADYATARPFYMGEGRGSYSLISFSALFILGFLCCVPQFARARSLLFAALAGLFLFNMIWLNQRADTVFLFAATILFSALAGFWRPEYRRLYPYWTAILFTVSIALVLILFLRNGVNLDYWADGGLKGFNDRLDLAQRVQAPLPGDSPLDLAQSVQAPLPGDSPLGSVLAGSDPYFWWGRGLAAFAKWHPDVLYPHNIFFESWFELGLAGTLPLLVALVYASLLGAWRGLSGNFTPDGLALWMMSAILLMNTMKAGDFSSIGTLLFVLTVSIAVTRRQQPL